MKTTTYLIYMRNKCTLIVDGNWLLNSRMFVMSDRFRKNLHEDVRKAAQADLTDRLARSIAFTLSKISVIDNVIIVADGGSWRKQLPKPKLVQGITYKGNRSLDDELDWIYIFDSLNNLCSRCAELSLTVSRYTGIEGDDWVWYWTRRLNSEGTNCIIWSVDNDLKQLVQVDNGAFTAWYCSDKTGLFLPKELEQREMSDIDFMMNPDMESPLVKAIKTATGKVSYIDPNTIITDKIICGDTGDNIKSVIRYVKNGRNRRIGEKEWFKLAHKYGIVTINDLSGEKENNIIKELVSTYASSVKDLTIDTLREMIEYNKKLVWLNEAVIPESLIAKMNEIEYKQYDLSYIRNNYKAMISSEESTDIENLFDEIK